jgi:alkanesulfonate monooxygenase SsuD/methylene tetrahydromethanopterin reductase-like flavin-dependent oxidoreductase (luciferase family)
LAYFIHSGPQFNIDGEFTLPRAPQGEPVVIQAGDSDEGREFAAKSADVIFSRHGSLEDGNAFFTDVKRRLTRYGRDHDDLLIMPAATFVLGNTEKEARENAREIRYQQVCPARRSSSLNRSGTATYAVTTSTAGCPTSTPTRTPSR